MIDIEINSPTTTNDPNNPMDLTGNDITAIFEDKDGEIWIGTDGKGLNRFYNQRKNIINYTSNSSELHSLSSNKITGICESLDGYIWVGTSDGLNRFDKRDGKFIQYKHRGENSIKSNRISTLYYDEQKNELYIGFFVGGVDIFHLSNSKFTHYFPDENTNNNITGSQVLVIYKGSVSGLVIGTLLEGVYQFIPESKNFKHYRLLPELNPLSHTGKSLNSNRVTSILEDSNGVIWIVTTDRGLNRYDPSTGSFTYYTTKDGLSNNSIYGILADNSGKLWMSTNKGLSCFNPKTETFKNYTANDGLQSNEFNQGAYFKSSKGELFFGGVNGFNSFFPDKINDNDYIPPVYLTNFKVFNEILPLPNPIPNESEIVLSYSQNFFSFEFVALNFTAPEKNQYAYRLEGFDKDWHYVPASQRYASYTNLDPGKYVLHIKGSNNDDLWNEKGTSISIIITPPFWMTWWFRIILIVFVIGIVIFIYNYRVQQLLKIERIRFQIATDLHDDIGTSLTGIALYSDLAKQEIKEKTSQAIERLDRIAEFSRSMLDQMNDIVWFIKPENDSLESAILRISDSANTLFEAKGKEYHTNISGEIKNIKLSMEQRRNILLIFKEMVNNVLKHSYATEVKIDFIMERNSDGKEGMAISVSDNGCGFDLDNVIKGNGINSMKSRAASIGVKIDINSIIGKGTQLKLFVPF